VGHRDSRGVAGLTKRGRLAGGAPIASGQARGKARRAELLAAGWRHELAAEEIAIRESAVSDPDPCVRIAAIGALARMSKFRAVDLQHSLADDDPRVRRRACRASWAGSSRPPIARECFPLSDDPDLLRSRPPIARECLPALTTALDDPVWFVAVEAAVAIGECVANDDAFDDFPLPGATVEALGRLATGHPEQVCREAALGALGALGDLRGLPAVLAAIADRPPVRRRAVVALAGFDHPSASRALAAGVDDPDWQVRQAARSLLADLDAGVEA